MVVTMKVMIVMQVVNETLMLKKMNRTMKRHRKSGFVGRTTVVLDSRTHGKYILEVSYLKRRREAMV